MSNVAERDRPVREAERTLSIGDLLMRIEAEYREMPGLSLTLPQAKRLWGLDTKTCAIVLETLIERRVLRRARTGQYLRGPSA